MAKFRARARTVDMLGRQQIAGIPTAINELFKNAHDAYADKAEVDFYRSDRLFVLRDDGIGMSREDFEERWLTIGTESKLNKNNANNILRVPSDPDKTPRSILGEKGIGRLAIAVIGPQVLILTRAKTSDGSSKLVMAFVYWGLFELPGLNLEEIEIPIQVFEPDEYPSNEDVEGLLDVVRNHVAKLNEISLISQESANRIFDDLLTFKFDFDEVTASLGKPTLRKDGHGTHFFICPAREELVDDLDAIYKEGGDSRIRKLLVGFSNTMLPNMNQPVVSTAFRYWQTNDNYTDVISESLFFTPEDFFTADIQIQGKFDDFGQFLGSVKIYNKVFNNHVVPWPKGSVTKPACGEFQIDVGYIPGHHRDSKLPPDTYATISNKLASIGGLYIYKDGVRILPYGDSDVDFLNIEKRRSLGAAYYFFSYRRIFGAISLTQKENRRLAEKAGREGFQDNRAYRDFRDILEHFFIQLAVDFFRSDSEFQDVREQNRLERAGEKQQKIGKEKRHKVSKSLDDFFYKINNGTLDREVETILDSVNQNIQEASLERNQVSLLNAEIVANKQLTHLKKQYEIERPAGVGFSAELKRDWSVYTNESQRIEQEVFHRARIRVQEAIAKATADLNLELDRNQRLELLINDIVIDSNQLVTTQIQSTGKVLTGFRERYDELTKEVRDKMDATIKGVKEDLNRLGIDNMQEEEIENYRIRWSTRIAKEAQNYTELLKHIQNQLEEINWQRDEETGFLIGSAEITAALEDETIALRERVDADLELTQLGMALAVINHEFSNTIRGIRNGIKSLRVWAQDSPQLMPTYREIADGFTHLDAYLTMFTPLNRRLYRNRIEIRGADIATYLRTLFRRRLDELQIELVASKSFQVSRTNTYPATLYPVFVNLLDNAIFWLKDIRYPRIIELDSQSGALLISDNGRGISLRDKEAVFELGFSRKPGGRGMGLYISKETLKKEGFEIRLIEPKLGNGTTFEIRSVDRNT